MTALRHGLLAGVLLLTGAACGGGGESAKSATTTTTETKSSPQQVASVIARDSGHFAEWYKKFDDCSKTVAWTCMTVSHRIDMHREMTQGAADLDAALRRSQPWSDEIRPLAQDTLAAGMEFVAQYQRDVETCIDANRGGSIQPCEPALEANGKLARELAKQLDGWAPYL